MKVTLAASILLGLLPGALALPSQLDAAEAALPIMKQRGGLMDLKMASRQRCRETGLCGKFTPERRVTKKAACVNGFAGEYPCENVDLLDQLTHVELGSTNGTEGNDCWGWVAPDGREIGFVGQTTGTAFVEISTEGEMTYLGRLPTQTEDSIWRDIKVKGNYAYITSEASGHGYQIFDMTKLLDPSLRTKPKTFSTSTDVTVFKGFGSAHNAVEGPAGKDYMVAVGQVPCSGGPYFVGVSDPTNPQDLGCWANDGYTHDAQIVIYNGPDSRYTGKEVLFGYNEDTLTILDVTNKKNITLISRTPYAGSAYTHQGWLISDKHTHLLSDDELDEEQATSTAADGHTRTYVWNVSNLSAPKLDSIYRSPVTSIDHNQYIHNGRSYQANYASGLRIVDVSKVESGGGAASMSQVGFFDVYPEGNPVDFYGSWNAFRFPSGHILVNAIERGAFLVKETV